VNGGWRVDRNAFAFVRPVRPDNTFGKPDLRDGYDPVDWTQQVYQGSNVVGSDVQHRPRARLKKEMWIRMPALHAVGHNRRVDGDGFSDLATVDHLSRSLDAGPQDRIRRTAHAQTLLIRQFHKGGTVG